MSYKIQSNTLHLSPLSSKSANGLKGSVDVAIDAVLVVLVVLLNLVLYCEVDPGEVARGEVELVPEFLWVVVLNLVVQLANLYFSNLEFVALLLVLPPGGGCGQRDDALFCHLKFQCHKSEGLELG